MTQTADANRLFRLLLINSAKDLFKYKSFFLLIHVSLFSPLAMAGFSFSSKLAVISKGRFGEKLRLYFQLFLSRAVFVPSWIFFALRLVIELLFVIILPLIILLVIDVYWIRIPLATLIATPVYSYLKMASFKFFLEVYGAFPLVAQEYREYYQRHQNFPKVA